MEQKKFNWWLLLIVFFLTVVILAVFFWDIVSIYIAPKAVLTSAVNDVLSQLEERFQNDPLLIVARNMDPEGKYTVDLDLKTTNKLLGPVEYDMCVETNLDAHQVYADGCAATENMQLDLSCYLDTEFMAVASEDLLSGTYYGIRYDSFSQDIQKIPLLNFFISDNMISQWNTSILTIQENMKRNYTIQQLPEFSENEIKTLLVGILALPCEIEKTSVSVDTSYLECYAISYSMSPEQMQKIFSETEDTGLTVTFYLYEDKLVKVQLQCVNGAQSNLYALDLGLAPKENQLSLHGAGSIDGELQSFCISVDTQCMEDQYLESWKYSGEVGGRAEERAMQFRYQPSSGLMDLYLDGSGEAVSLYFNETDSGFQIETGHFEQLIELLRDGSMPDVEREAVYCKMAITNGSEITAPAYKKLDQWSMEDFWTLLSGVGALIGIQIKA